jgi:hypothetical protein
MLSGTTSAPHTDIQQVYAPSQFNINYNYLPPTNFSFPPYVASNPAMLAFPGFVYPVGLTTVAPAKTTASTPMPPTETDKKLPTSSMMDASKGYTEPAHPKIKIRNKEKPETVKLKRIMQQSQLEWTKKPKGRRKRKEDTGLANKSEDLTSVKLDEPPILPLILNKELFADFEIIEQMKRAIELLTSEKKELQKKIGMLYSEKEHWKSKYYLLESQILSPSSVSEVFGPQPPTLTYAQNKAAQEQPTLQEMLKVFEFVTPPGSTTNSPMKPKNR